MGSAGGPEAPLSRDEAIQLVLDHCETPLNHGALKDASVSRFGGNPGCGDEVTVYLRTGEGDRVEAVGFEAVGCYISRAAASMATELVKGKTLDEIEAIPPDAILRVLGRELAMTRPRCAMLGLNTFRSAVRDLRATRLRQEAGTGLGS